MRAERANSDLPGVEGDPRVLPMGGFLIAAGMAPTIPECVESSPIQNLTCGAALAAAGASKKAAFAKPYMPARRFAGKLRMATL